ncbi:hypothetical protein AC579_4798 [Pseudocercospora musae]|uniref:DUF410 domain-containing protein n=1 Tax=Pseudocercospora musae TaxID=113226 RepID=A0A139IIA5_9PEZI|nr:hypothetical protein AC579_4798 [Pseudocercospora musae]
MRRRFSDQHGGQDVPKNRLVPGFGSRRTQQAWESNKLHWQVLSRRTPSIDRLSGAAHARYVCQDTKSASPAKGQVCGICRAQRKPAGRTDNNPCRIEEGDFYEAHQQLLTIANRYVKSSSYADAIELLSSGATLLLKAGAGSSGADLCTYLIDIYQKSELKPDTANKARLLSLLRAFPLNEPGKKKFVAGIVEWSSKFGEFPAGDPELHHVIGTLYAEEGEVYDAERHLTLGTSDSAAVFADTEYTWYETDEPSTASHYAARAVFPYLLVGNTRAANKALLLFTSRLSTSHPGLGVQSISSPSSDIRIYPSLPLLNFLGLLLLAIQRGSSDLFKTLKSHYATHLKEVSAWEEPMLQIGEMYFGIKIPSQSNPMMDMMSSLLMGGNNPFAAKKREPQRVQAAGSEKPSEAGTPQPPAPGVE